MMIYKLLVKKWYQLGLFQSYHSAIVHLWKRRGLLIIFRKVKCYKISCYNIISSISTEIIYNPLKWYKYLRDEIFHYKCIDHPETKITAFKLQHLILRNFQNWRRLENLQSYCWKNRFKKCWENGAILYNQKMTNQIEIETSL